MDEQYCPRCKTTKYRNPSLKLLVNICGHALCDNCVELLFVRGSGACPQCNTALRRNNFRVQIFEDSVVEKEVDIRKKIYKDFNKKEEDFQSLREYNDYLEMVETIVFNLTSGIDVEETRRQIEDYKRENLASIKKNRAKLSKDDEYLEQLIEQEKHEQDYLRQQIATEEREKELNKRKDKEALIEQLMFSDLPAHDILATHKQEVTEHERQAANTFSSGIKMGAQNAIRDFPVEPAIKYSYIPLELDYCGPEVPLQEELEPNGYLKHMRSSASSELAGGYVSSIGCHRALQEAFAGLFFSSLDLDQQAVLAGAKIPAEHSFMEVAS